MDKIYHTKQPMVKGWFLVVFFCKILLSGSKGISLCNNLNFLNPILLQPDGVHFKLKLSDTTEFEVSKVSNIGLQRYRDCKIRVVAKIKLDGIL